MSAHTEPEFCADCARHELWEYGWHRAADEAPDAELPALVEQMERERGTEPWTCPECRYRNEAHAQLCHGCAWDSSRP